MEKRIIIIHSILVLLLIIVVIYSKPSCTYEVQPHKGGCSIPFIDCQWGLRVPGGPLTACDAPLKAIPCGETAMVCGDKIICECE